MFAVLLLLSAVAAPSAAGLPNGAVDRLGAPILRHSSLVAAVAFSPDGKRLASGSNVNLGGTDPAVKVWDVETGHELFSVRHDSTGVAWFADGTRVASASRDGTIKAWELATGREVFTSGTDGGWALGVAVSPDGKRLASIHGNRRTVRLWDTAKGALVRELEPGGAADPFHTEFATVAFHPDGKLVAAGVPRVGLMFWNIDTGERTMTIPGEYTGSNWHEHRNIEFVGREARVAVCQPDGLGVFDSVTGKQLKSTRGTRAEDPSRMSISSVAQSADGTALVLVRNHELKLWNLATDREVRSFGQLRGPFALSPDGQRLASTDGNSVMLLDTATGRRLPADRGIDGRIRIVGFGPTGEALVLSDSSLRVWDIGPSGKRRGEKVPLPDAEVVALSPDGRTAVHGGHSTPAKAHLSDIATGRIKVSLEVNKKESVLHGVFHPDGKRLVTVDTGNRILSMWDITTGKRLRKFAGHEDPVDTIAISPDGRRMATSGVPRAYIRTPFEGYVGDPGIRMWDLDTGAQLPHINGRASWMAYSPDGSLLAIAFGNHAPPRLVDSATGQYVRELKTPKWVGPERIAFTPDGRTIVGVGRDKMVRLWDVTTGDERRVFAGHTGELYCLAISQDGRRVMSSGDDGLVYIWDIDAPDRPPP